MLKKFLWFFAFCVVGSAAAMEPADFAKYYEIDLDAPVPDIKELEHKYYEEESNYNPKYAYRQEIGDVFDAVFRTTIMSYGTTEKRLRSSTEEGLFELLQMLPKEYYQYIGPAIHIASGMPEKIKNMPGIKETKNKFPTRIAPQLADMENIEFLSPYLYILLMPEIWPENVQNVEYVLPQDDIKVKATLPKSFMEKVHKIVPPYKFYPDYKPDNSPKMTDLRTISPTKDSPLTSGDIKAFANSIDKVYEFSKQGDNYMRVMNASILLNKYEAENGTALPMNTLKDIVNPCQRMIQKIKFAGLEVQFLQVISQDGFDLKGWAYTCDKTIKAYRKTIANSYVVTDIVNYKQGNYNDYIKTQMSEKNQRLLFSTMQGAIEMYSAPEHDWVEVMEHRKMLNEHFKKIEYMLMGEPFTF